MPREANSSRGKRRCNPPFERQEKKWGLSLIRPRNGGVLHFQFTDGYSVHCVVFLAHGCEGEPIETDEALPMWTHVEEIPFHEMWADDALWLPLVLQGRVFRAYFVFDGEKMLSHRIEFPKETPVEACPCVAC